MHRRGEVADVLEIFRRGYVVRLAKAFGKDFPARYEVEPVGGLVVAVRCASHLRHLRVKLMAGQDGVFGWWCGVVEADDGRVVARGYILAVGVSALGLLGFCLSGVGVAVEYVAVYHLPELSRNGHESGWTGTGRRTRAAGSCRMRCWRL
jgi:hypothetical protein